MKIAKIEIHHILNNDPKFARFLELRLQAESGESNDSSIKRFNIKQPALNLVTDGVTVEEMESQLKFHYSEDVLIWLLFAEIMGFIESNDRPDQSDKIHIILENCSIEENRIISQLLTEYDVKFTQFRYTTRI